jgi:CRP-like cAMP-binding protein
VDFDQEIPMQITKTFQGGDIIIEEGTKGTSAYVILSGAVEVLKKSADKEVTVATLGEGSSPNWRLESSTEINLMIY